MVLGKSGWGKGSKWGGLSACEVSSRTMAGVDRGPRKHRKVQRLLRGSRNHDVLNRATPVSVQRDEQGQTKGSQALLDLLSLCPLNTEGYLLFCFSVPTWPASIEMP